MPQASLLLLTLLILAIRGYAQEPPIENTIRWAKPGFAPLFIFTGEYKNKGVGDLIFDRIEQLLPQYQHDTIRANYIRAVTEIRRGKNVCAILHHTTEREKFSHFTNTLFIVPAYSLYISAFHKDRFSGILESHVGQISFDKLLANNTNLRMAHSRGHSYGQVLDNILAKHRNNVQISKGHSGQKALIKMLLAGRVDLILEAPWVLNYHLRELNSNYSELHKISLSETQPFMTVSIGCAKTAWGKQIVSGINEVMPSLWEPIKDMMTTWLEPDEVEDYIQAHNQYFKRQLERNGI